MAHISTRQASQMCQRLGTALHAGLDILATLRREAGYGSPAYRRNMAEVAERVSGGATLAEAMRESSPYFPQLTCELVDVGEQTGNLESVLLRLSEHYQHLLRLRRTFLFGILWPVVQLTVAILVIGLLILLLGVLGTSATFFGLQGTRGVTIYATVVIGLHRGVGIAGARPAPRLVWTSPRQFADACARRGDDTSDDGAGSLGVDAVVGPQCRH